MAIGLFTLLGREGVVVMAVHSLLLKKDYPHLRTGKGDNGHKSPPLLGKRDHGHNLTRSLSLSLSRSLSLLSLSFRRKKNNGEVEMNMVIPSTSPFLEERRGIITNPISLVTMTSNTFPKKGKLAEPMVQRRGRPSALRLFDFGSHSASDSPSFLLRIFDPLGGPDPPRVCSMFPVTPFGPHLGHILGHLGASWPLLNLSWATFAAKLPYNFAFGHLLGQTKTSKNSACKHG